ncbi:ABC transporter ATP-binding protein [Clostridium senegalense]|uniref:ABC transporter ATP-binding protein n=1 Tax=Clostridium senegalense TaxID=1465809 RepID=UPI001C114FA2|nr:ABC transporter ATP-binding protein [Clostridium senegalense]MBU5225850.1 ABC transporter ATP-binding protein [Clostridium senegalense]
MANILEVKDVYKELSKRPIIKGISFEVKEGEVFGFLGSNGAGKTTTIRMLVGLIKPNKGTIKINGYDIQKDFVKAIRSVGCIVENPELYLDLTGRQNLRLFARMYGDITEDKIQEVIDFIGLNERIDDKVKKYSLGMKQRLGLGQALLGNPKLLILDEPTNGLDPSGIVEFRNIIKKLVKENNTAVFISSHILSEIELLCDRVAFINNGTIKSIELTENLVKNSTDERICLITPEKEKGKELLFNLYFVKHVEEEGEKLLFYCKKGTFPKLIEAFAKRNIPIEEINKAHQNLENRFMEIMEGEE